MNENENKNNQNNFKDLELRIIIIGDEKVGKKTLAKRIQMLNSSETKTVKQNIKLYHETREEERKKKLNKLIIKNKVNKEKQIESFDYRDKETKTYEEKELKKEGVRKNLMTIQKIYKFCSFNNIKMNIFPCIEMQPILNDNSEDENHENNDFEKKYNKSIKGLINEIMQIISIPAKNIYDKINFLFLFCFDLSNFNTFKDIHIYFNELNHKFNICDNFNMALIGNKKDVKKILSGEQKNILESFINNVNIKYYEISSLLYFNFENFFEKLIFDIFENNTHYNYNSKEFKEKFHIIINERPHFSKSQRTLNPKDIFPGPNQYDNNPYEYPLSKKTILNLFKTKNKYNKKIFINKNGPLYPKIINGKNKKKENEFDENIYKNFKKNSSIEESKTKSITIDTQINKNIAYFLEHYSRKPGYSFTGYHKSNSFNLRKNRRKINVEKIKEMTEALGNEISLNITNKKLKKIKSFDKRNAYSLKRDLFKKRLESEELLRERHYNIKLKNESLENEKINKIIEKEKKYSKKYLQKKKEIYRAKLNYFKKELKTSLSMKEKKYNKEPKAKFYDAISSISLNKGFTFGVKPENKELKLIYADYPYLLDDFEKIVKKNQSKKEIKTYSDRFPKYRTEEVGDSREDMEIKQKNYELKRKKLKSNALTEFFNTIKQHKKANLLKKKKIKEKEDEKYNNLYNSKYFLTEIQYSQVETSFPKYSIRGKLDLNKNIDRENKNLEFFDIDGFLENNKIKCRKFSLEEEENPNIAKVKPNYPKYSFGKDERFKKTLSNLGKHDENNQNWLFRNGIFGYSDKQSHLKTQTFMGMGKKLNSYKDNGVPGPGQYSIKGFADLITFRNYKDNKSYKTERNELNKKPIF